MVQFTYPITTPEAQYEILINKGLIDDVGKEVVLHFLRHHSYFQTMLYFMTFIDNTTKNFVPKTSWSKIQSTYQFDQKLRGLLFGYICEIENSFKNNFCQITCQKFGNIRWSDPAFFTVKKCYFDFISDTLKEILDKTIKNEIIKKYIAKYDDPPYPPFWNMLEVFTFGQISVMYKSIDNPTKKEIANLYGIDNSILENWIQAIVGVRNICCHHNKLYDNLFKTPIIVTKKHSAYFQGNNNLFSVIGVIHYFCRYLKIEKKFSKDLKELVDSYPIVNHGLPADRQARIVEIK